MKYMNVPAHLENNYWSIEEIRELKDFFAKKAIVWAIGLEKPNVAEKHAYIVFKNVMNKV